MHSLYKNIDTETFFCSLVGSLDAVIIHSSPNSNSPDPVCHFEPELVEVGCYVLALIGGTTIQKYQDLPPLALPPTSTEWLHMYGTAFLALAVGWWGGGASLGCLLSELAVEPS